MLCCIHFCIKIVSCDSNVQKNHIWFCGLTYTVSWFLTLVLRCISFFSSVTNAEIMGVGRKFLSMGVVLELEIHYLQQQRIFVVAIPHTGR